MISAGMVGAAPQIALPTSNITMWTRKSHLISKTPYALDQARMAVLPSEKLTPIQEKRLTRPKLAKIDGWIAAT
jgi:hypothetical protein